jgi:hypothetical protein
MKLDGVAVRYSFPEPRASLSPMTERERWVVYPLLFLALGAALRDKLIDRTTTKSIVCEELAVVDQEPTTGAPARILAKIGREPGVGGGGYLWVNGNIDIIDGDATGQFGHTLVKLGRARTSPTANAFGFLTVSGQVVVDGLINATDFAYRNALFMPLPGATMPNLLQGMPATPRQQAIKPGSRNAPDTPPEVEAPPGSSEKATSASPEKSATGSEPPAEK